MTTAEWWLSLPPAEKAEVEREVQARLVDAFLDYVYGPPVHPTALLAHPSATPADIDAAVAYYSEKRP